MSHHQMVHTLHTTLDEVGGAPVRHAVIIEGQQIYVVLAADLPEGKDAQTWARDHGASYVEAMSLRKSAWQARAEGNLIVLVGP